MLANDYQGNLASSDSGPRFLCPALQCPRNVGPLVHTIFLYNGTCLPCKLRKWTPFSVGGHCQQTNGQSPSPSVGNVSIVMTTQMDTGVILSIRHEVVV